MSSSCAVRLVIDVCAEAAFRWLLPISREAGRALRGFDCFIALPMSFGHRSNFNTCLRRHCRYERSAYLDFDVAERMLRRLLAGPFRRGSALADDFDAA